MKLRKAFLFSTLCVSSLVVSAWSRPVDLAAPGSGLGAADPHGYLQIWRDMNDVGIQLDKQSFLPLRYGFSTDPAVSGILGAGFSLPMFEAKALLIREKMMKAYLPCGKGLYLRRDPIEATKFQSVNKEWTGDLTKDDFVLWRDDGWKLIYHLGRLTSLTSDDNHIFTWQYYGNLPARIDRDGLSLVQLEYAHSGQLSAISFYQKRFKIELGQRPLTEKTLGQNVVKQLAPALSIWNYPDGKQDVFKFDLTPDRSPTVTLNDREQKQSTYTWDAATSYLTSEQIPDGRFTYQVEAVGGPFGLPPIIRTDDKGKSDRISVDTQKGIYMVQADATTITNHLYESPGPLYHKVHYIEKTVDGHTTTIYKASYDDKGRLLRQTNAKGFVTEYTYDSAGKSISCVMHPPSDPQLLNQLKQRETSILQSIESTIDQSQRDALLEQLGFLYIHDIGIPEKALALLPQVTSRQVAFDISLHAIDGDVRITNEQKGLKLKALEKQFPEQSTIINMISSARLRGH